LRSVGAVAIHDTTDSPEFSFDLVRKLDMPIVRYPGGNFVSGWDWKDSIGLQLKEKIVEEGDIEMIVTVIRIRRLVMIRGFNQA